MPVMSTFRLALPITCLDMLHLGAECAALEKDAAVELLFPIGDGTSAPFMSGLDPGRSICAHTTLRCHALLFASRPERHIDAVAEAGYAAMTISLEAATHHHRTLTRIRQAGMRAGVAINPATSLTALDYLLDKADHVCLLGTEFDGGDTTVMLSAVPERTAMLRENITYRKLQTEIMLYGGLNMTVAQQAVASGASCIAIDKQMLTDTGETELCNAVRRCAESMQPAHDTN